MVSNLSVAKHEISMKKQWLIRELNYRLLLKYTNERTSPVVKNLDSTAALLHRNMCMPCSTHYWKERDLGGPHSTNYMYV